MDEEMKTNEAVQAEAEAENVSLPDTDSLERCLVFESGGMVMFMSTDNVSEIINDHSVTTLPAVPPYVAGIMNLRGQILPVVDTGMMMGKKPHEYDSRTCIIVLNIEEVPVGIIVDNVRQVVDIDTSEIQPIPIRGQQKLANGMLDMGNGVTAMSFDCNALIQSR